MKHDARLQLLEAEYFKLQDIIESFDAKALQFKGWSVTVTLAGAATALLSDKTSDRQRIEVLALAAFGSLTFWLTESMWKVFQQSFFGRLRDIETAMVNYPTVVLAPLQINAGWKRRFATQRWATFWKYATKPNSMLPHLAVTAICLLLVAYVARNAPPVASADCAAASRARHGHAVDARTVAPANDVAASPG